MTTDGWFLSGVNGAVRSASAKITSPPQGMRFQTRKGFSVFLLTYFSLWTRSYRPHDAVTARWVVSSDTQKVRPIEEGTREPFVEASNSAGSSSGSVRPTWG
ncbi:hypothetical protein CTI14_13115 [Methylobacterium radiotolerans]|nr:hypothetical protein CTI14_13115 [Methylobacterium radiotolerans]